MKNIIKLVLISSLSLLIFSCNDYDDGELRSKIEQMRKRHELLQEKVGQLNGEVEALAEIINGELITAITKDQDGNSVITYKDGKGIEHTLIIATEEDIVDLPILGIKKDADQAFYWTTTTDGVTDWLLDGASKKIAVSGHTPEIGVDVDGYWTIDGVVLLDSNSVPMVANTESTSLFKSVEQDDSGNLKITLADDNTITIKVFEVLGITSNTPTNSVIADATLPFVIYYSLVGSASAYAIVEIAKAEGLTAVLDKDASTVTVTFSAGFTSASVMLVAYDLEENTVIKPFFFRKN